MLNQWHCSSADLLFKFFDQCLKCLIVDSGSYQVHMEADRKALPRETNTAGPHCQEKITYKVGSKVITMGS